jgi:hypothetical protein
MGELATAAHASDNAMRLTIDVAPGDSPFGSWVSICHELGCTGNSSTPHGAVAGLAKAMNAIVQGILDMRGTPDAGLDVIREIATGYAEQRRESVPVRQPLAGVRQLVRPIAGTR